jgi:uncharacterized protein
MASLLKPQLSNAIKAAMRAKEVERLSTLRLLHAAIRQKEIDERIELDDAQITSIIEKQIKQRRESIAAYEHAGRTETADSEKAEVLVLQQFLPQPATAQEIESAIQAAVAQVTGQGTTGGAAMGKVMAILKASLAGRAEMAAVSKQVKSRLM